jgi:hypothetical protein
MNSIFINLTPHAITVHALSVDESSDSSFTLPPSGKVARVEFRKAFTTLLGGGWNIPIAVQSEGKTIDLPEQNEVDQMIYIVSGLVREANPHRTDLYSPGDLLRNKEGQPIGCMGLVGNPFPKI